MIQQVVLHMCYMDLFILFAYFIFNLQIHYIFFFTVSFEFDFVSVLLYQTPERKGRSVGLATCWYLYMVIDFKHVFLIITVNR
jgi:hypothetical protein